MKKKEYTLADLAKLTQSKLVGKADHLIKNVADLDSATSEDISFLSNPRYVPNPRYVQAMLKSHAGAIFIDQQTFGQYPRENTNFLINENPSHAFQVVVELYHRKLNKPSGFEGIHPTAVIHSSATIGKNVTIGPHAVIDNDVIIGDDTFIGVGTYIGPETIIGKECLIHPRVTIREHCQLGNRVIVQPGAVIGSCGFGYTTDNKGIHSKLNQIGNVTIEDDVEIGANTTIDRARFKTTRIGKGTKIDNLVQIAHGVVIGAHNIIVGQTGIAGSTQTGKYVVLAGQVAVAGHIKLDDGVIVSACSGVSKSLSKGTYGGIPALPIQEYNRNSVFLRNIESYINQLKDLQKRLTALESGV